MIDSHCHLADPAFRDDLEAVIARAREAGVERALVILAAGDREEEGRMRRIEALWPEIRVAVGVHPHAAGAFAGDPDAAAALVRRAMESTSAARAVGEIGLDYHYDFSPRDVQREMFRAQLRLARELDRPVVVHTRQADEDTMAILGEGGGSLRGVLHCFTGDLALARAGLALGLQVSIAGIVTFPRADALRRVVAELPLDRMLTETDSPYLAPVPYRGRRNEPAYVARVVECLASLVGLPAADVAARTAANFHALFGP